VNEVIIWFLFFRTVNYIHKYKCFFIKNYILSISSIYHYKGLSYRVGKWQRSEKLPVPMLPFDDLNRNKLYNQECHLGSLKKGHYLQSMCHFGWSTIWANSATSWYIQHTVRFSEYLLDACMREHINQFSHLMQDNRLHERSHSLSARFLIFY
jgi:hypothetical protein